MKKLIIILLSISFLFIISCSNMVEDVKSGENVMVWDKSNWDESNYGK